MRLYKVRKGNEEQRINERLSARCIFKIVPLYWFQLHMFSQNNIRIVNIYDLLSVLVLCTQILCDCELWAPIHSCFSVCIKCIYVLSYDFFFFFNSLLNYFFHFFSSFSLIVSLFLK